MFPHWNSKGLVDIMSSAAGGLQHCTSSGVCTRDIVSSGLWTPSVKGLFKPLVWFGSLVEDKRDGVGQLFRRNRYIDPNSGRFTQEDPIGLAGGINSYGFANGDPLNYTDPFGLKSCDPPNLPCRVGNQVRSLLDGIGAGSVPVVGSDASTNLYAGFTVAVGPVSIQCTAGAKAGCEGNMQSLTIGASVTLDLGHVGTGTPSVLRRILKADGSAGAGYGPVSLQFTSNTQQVSVGAAPFGAKVILGDKVTVPNLPNVGVTVVKF